MPNINQKRLDQMIENAISFKQSSPPEEFSPLFRNFKNFISKPIITSMALVSFVIVTISLIPTQRSLYASDVDEIYDLVMADIFDDF